MDAGKCQPHAVTVGLTAKKNANFFSLSTSLVHAEYQQKMDAETRTSNHLFVLFSFPKQWPPHLGLIPVHAILDTRVAVFGVALNLVHPYLL